MIHRPLWKVKILLPGEIIDLTGAKVADVREVAEEEEDDIHPCFSRGGGCFLDLELPTGEHIEVLCPFINRAPIAAMGLLFGLIGAKVVGSCGVTETVIASNEDPVVIKQILFHLERNAEAQRM